MCYNKSIEKPIYKLKKWGKTKEPKDRFKKLIQNITVINKGYEVERKRKGGKNDKLFRWNCKN